MSSPDPEANHVNRDPNLFVRCWLWCGRPPRPVPIILELWPPATMRMAAPPLASVLNARQLADWREGIAVLPPLACSMAAPASSVARGNALHQPSGTVASMHDWSSHAWLSTLLLHTTNKQIIRNNRNVRRGESY